MHIAVVEANSFDFLGIEGNIDIWLNLEAFHDVGVLNGPDTRNDLLVADALAGRLVDLIELNLGSTLGCGVDVDID